MSLNLLTPQYPAIQLGMKGRHVKIIQETLIKLGYSLTANGVFGQETLEVVKAFQEKNGLVNDGIIGKKTIQYLKGELPVKPLLQQSDIQQAANLLNVEVASIMAVNAVESKGSGFLKDGRCVILYERHIMRRRLLLKGYSVEPWCASKPNLVNVNTGGYLGGSAEYDRLYEAMGIDREAALESASWGAYQIMGFHWKHLGYQNVDDYVEKMDSSEAEQLNAFVRFIKADQRLHTAMKERNWKQFALIFNGPAYASHKVPYDVRLANAYKTFDAQYRLT